MWGFSPTVSLIRISIDARAEDQKDRTALHGTAESMNEAGVVPGFPVSDGGPDFTLADTAWLTLDVAAA